MGDFTPDLATLISPHTEDGNISVVILLDTECELQQYFRYPSQYVTMAAVAGLLHDQAAEVAVAVGVSVRGQQQADHHLRPHPPHHLHHQGGGLHQHRTRPPLLARPGQT